MTTNDVSDTRISDELPRRCPFCDDPMKVVHGTLSHVEQGKCPIGAYAWGGASAVGDWNIRTYSEPVNEPAEWQVEKCKLYHSQWSAQDRLKARGPYGLTTDDGEAWRYQYTHSDGEGGAYDLVYRPRVASIPAPERSKEETGDGPDWERAARTFLSADDFAALQSLAVAFAEDRAAGVDTSLETPPLHKEGEVFAWAWKPDADGAWTLLFRKPDTGISKPIYAAPVPVTITDAAREGWERGRNSWCPAGILADEARTEREWAKELPRILDALSKPTGEE